MPELDSSWNNIASEFEKPYFQFINRFVEMERQNFQVFPEEKEVYTAFQLTPYDQVKILILGQDPYHDVGQAHGLSFSVKKGIKIPPSLRNIYKELETDLGIPPSEYGDLTAWAKQGVLLLNSVLTVRAHKAASHRSVGWQEFTDTIIQKVSEKPEPVVFILWGAYARDKVGLIDSSKHLIIESAHPSPLSAYNGFFGSKPFSRANEFLLSHNLQPIDWRVDG